MSVNATEGVSPGIFAMAGSSTDATRQAGDDQQMFLELMVAQLRYQDPLNPTDSGEFLAQNAQFTALEKMQEVADATNALLSVQMAFGASGMIGKTVTWTDADGDTRSGTVSGATFLATGPVLDVAGEQIPLGAVTSVATPANTGATDTTSEDPTGSTAS
ncbi:MAG TPA: flagellar hook capping FlgD N-terminal domain-containing protein [Nocardioides sp.]|uniref:flagellar hook assembly protein FlgD n=1 Tax=Nocardioides sp. TaxID=35761 RepID=UPI002EDA4B48